MNTEDTHWDSAGEGRAKSVWLDTTPQTAYAELEDGVTVDTAIIGGGIAGITTAYELRAAGQSVAVVDRQRILTGVTGHTTAKLTSQHGLIYDHLIKYFGVEKARQYANANQTAIDKVESTVTERDIDCEFERTPAYVYTTNADEREQIRDEVKAAQQLDLPASYTESTSLPFDVEGAVRFEDQARFHPRMYLLSLARTIPGDGSYIFEHTRANDVKIGPPCRVRTEHGTVTADDVVIATHFPILDGAFYFARLYPKRSYVIAGRLRTDEPEGMYYRPGEPYFSVRPIPAGDESMALFGGENHRTGHGGRTADRYRRLERYVRKRFDVESVAYRWSTQDYVSVDRVPFVGKHSPGKDHVYVATGFGGWGLTNGTAAGRLLSDLILDRENPWCDIYRPTRFRLGASKRALVRHNTDAVRHVVRDLLTNPPAEPISDLARGEGTVITAEGMPVGVHRDEDGEFHTVSARCTHMGCLLKWNDGEMSWDCPCHGSRFDVDGNVIDTPAIEDLDTYSVNKQSLSQEDSIE